MQSQADPIRVSIRHTIAIVDGDALYRWFVSETLEREGLQVAQFTNLADVGEYLSEHRVPVLLMIDADALRHGGAELLATLKRRHRAAGWVVLEPPAPRLDGPSVEGVELILKPTDPSTLQALVGTRAHSGPMRAINARPAAPPRAAGTSSGSRSSSNPRSAGRP